MLKMARKTNEKIISHIIYRNTFNNRVSDLDYNDDGSVDLYLGPTPPEGKEKNWIKTIPGKTWHAYFRWYGPTETYWDGSWKLNDIELVE